MMNLVDIDKLKAKRIEYIESGRAHSYDDMVAVSLWLNNAEVITIDNKQYDALRNGKEG